MPPRSRFCSFYSGEIHRGFVYVRLISSTFVSTFFYLTESYFSFPPARINVSWLIALFYCFCWLFCVSVFAVHFFIHCILKIALISLLTYVPIIQSTHLLLTSYPSLPIICYYSLFKMSFTHLFAHHIPSCIWIWSMHSTLEFQVFTDLNSFPPITSPYFPLFANWKYNSKT